MQYIFLRGIIDSTLTNFVCPQCQGKANEQSIFLTGMTSQGVDINIHCPLCSAHTLLHAEISSVVQQEMKARISKKTNKNTINDEDITNLYKNLKNAHSIEDILGTDE